jgi:hypothetical protein
MSFAILYELSDLNWIGGSTQTAQSFGALTNADRTLARKYWQNGIRDWATAPAYTGEPDTCPLCRILPCTYGTVAEFAALLHRVADALGGDALYLHAIAEDVVASGHIEPYPA